MAKILLGYPNVALSSTLSEGSWQAPLDNLKDRRTRIVGRTTNTDLASTKFKIALDSDNPVHIVALKRINFSQTAKIRVSSYTDSGYSTKNYDSGFQSVYGSVFDPSELEWEDNNFWLGTISKDKLALFTSLWYIVLDKQVQDKHWLIEIDDQNNEKGYLEIGYLFISDSWTPDVNIAYGASLQNENTTVSRSSLSGVSYYDTRNQKRAISFSLTDMEYTEGYQRAFDIDRELGIDQDIFVSIDHEDELNRFRNSVIGRLEDTSPLVFNRYANTTKNFKVREDA